MFEADITRLTREANFYNQLSYYYKYRNPQKYIECYFKHYQAVQNLIQSRSPYRVTPSTPKQHAKVRAFHASPNAPSVDIYINGQLIIQHISYKQPSNFFTLRQGLYRIDCYPSGTHSASIVSAVIPIMNNTTYTIAVVGNMNRMQVLSFVENSYLPYKESKIRFAHLSPDTPTVDLAFKNGEIIFPNIMYKQVTEYIQVTSGTADLEVRLTTTNKAILTIPNIKIEANKLYTIYAVGYTLKSPKLEGVFLTN